MTRPAVMRTTLLCCIGIWYVTATTQAQEVTLKWDSQLTLMRPTNLTAMPLLTTVLAQLPQEPLRLQAALLPRGIKPSAGVYEDIVLETDAQGVSLQGETAYSTYRAQGLPRGGSVEYRVLQQRTQDASGYGTRQNAIGLLTNGYIDTPQYGLLSASANLSTNDSAALNNSAPNSLSRAQTWRLDQRGFALTNQWRADHSAGFLYTPLPSLSRGANRTTLTSHPFQGLSGEWTRGADLNLNASMGQQGFFTGRDSQGFEVQRGMLQSFGGQLKLSGKAIQEESAYSALAIQSLKTSQLDARDTSVSANPMQARHSLWTSYAWQGLAPWQSSIASNESGPIAQRQGGLRVQAHMIQNEQTKGTSFDANWRTERLQHTSSLFYFQPGLAWGTASLANDIRGGAWRADFASRAWSAGAGLELSSPISQPDIHNHFANGFARYRIDSRNTAAANWAIRTGTAAGQSNQLTWDHLSDWGNSQWRADSLRSQNIQSSRVGIDQRWPSSTTRSFSTALAYSTSMQSGMPTQAIEWGLLGTTTWSRARLDANLRGTQVQQGGTNGNNLNASIDLSWPLAPNWSLVGQLNLVQGKSSAPSTVIAASAQASATALSTYQGQTLIIALRYQDRAGTASAPLGGAMGAASGSIEGVVFLDEDRNKERGSNEAGVEGVTVVLDKRFQTRTDAQGRFTFPSVAIGEHSLELIPDNVPLPWYALQTGARSVRVDVRSTLRVDYPLQRER